MPSSKISQSSFSPDLFSTDSPQQTTTNEIPQQQMTCPCYGTPGHDISTCVCPCHNDNTSNPNILQYKPLPLRKTMMDPSIRFAQRSSLNDNSSSKKGPIVVGILVFILVGTLIAALILCTQKGQSSTTPITGGTRNLSSSSSSTTHDALSDLLRTNMY